MQAAWSATVIRGVPVGGYSTSDFNNWKDPKKRGYAVFAEEDAFARHLV
jgi:hypothetical protein